MDKTRILVGRKENKEIYQLLTGLDYISVVYDGVRDRELFFDDLSNGLVDKLLQQKGSYELSTFNGLVINPDTGRYEKTLKLDDNILAILRQQVFDKFTRSQMAVPAVSNN